MVAGCPCHDPRVFGHQDPCVLGPPARHGRPRDYKAELSDAALTAALRVEAEYQRRITATMPRSKYAVMGGWLKKRG